MSLKNLIVYIGNRNGDDFTDKVTRMLSLYKKMDEGAKICKHNYSIEYDISQRTFDRDIEDLRIFLSEIFSDKEIVFDKKENVYYMTNRSEKT